MAFVLWAAVLALALLRVPALAEPPPCERLSHAGDVYTVCEVDLRRRAVRLYWRQPDGTPYAYLSALPRALAPRSGRLLFATNAGMFDPAHKPVGLYIENGRELVRANTRSGTGNFHLKPNGVFYVAGDTAGVLETSAYLRQRPKADFATQSGPMLVIDGRLHPKFDRASISLKARTGVGVRSPGSILFAISEGEVSFNAFGKLFRDRLKCTNALFLDGGSASSLYAPGLGRPGNYRPLGPMLGVFEKVGGSGAR